MHWSQSSKLLYVELVVGWVTISGYTVFIFNQPTLVNLAFHPSGVGKSSTGLSGWGEGGAHSLMSDDR